MRETPAMKKPAMAHSCFGVGGKCHSIWFGLWEEKVGRRELFTGVATSNARADFLPFIGPYFLFISR